MVTSLDPTAVGAAAAPAPERGRDAVPGSGFADLIGRVVEEANGQMVEAESQASELAAGRGDIVETLLAVSRADLSLRFVLSLRNRALDAYNEIMRLQV